VHYTEKEGLSNNFVTSIIEDKNGHLWFGTNGGGVTKYDETSFTHYTKKEGLSSNIVNSILEDKNEHLWFGTDGGGVTKYDGASFTHYTEKEGLSNNTVRSILEDKNGQLWFGTHGGGVSKYDGASFTHYTGKEGLSNNTVASILEDKNGNIWFGTYGGGVSKYDGASFTHYTDKEGLSLNLVRSILEDNNGHLWFGSWGSGVSKYDGASFIHYTEKEGLSNNSVLSMIEDKNGHLWFGTWGGGVTKYDGASFTHYTEKEGLSHNIVNSILEDKNGHLWFGTDAGGVSKYDGASFTHYTEKEGLSNNKVLSMLEDKNGHLWFGTWGGGLNKYDGTSFTYFTEKEGLSNNIVWSILEDKNTEKHEVGLYIATEKGLNHLVWAADVPSPNELKSKKGTFSIQSFGKRDGLKVLDMPSNSAFIDNKNRAWWGGGKGLEMLDLNIYKASDQIPQPILKQLDINEQFTDYRNISDSLKSEIAFTGVERFQNYPLNLELPFDKNHLTFRFAAVDWAAPHKIQFSYLMEGLNKTWNQPTKEGKADYTNLPHGAYTFKIRAIGESGKWSEPFEYSFTIHPPWWYTWWAYTIYALLFLGALRVFSRWRERRLRAEKEKLEKTVEERTKELKSSQAQLIQKEKLASLGELTAGIAHEIQNPLNFVNNFSEVSGELIAEIEAERTKNQETRDEILVGAILSDLKQNLEKINHHGKRADAIVKGMLQHSRTSSGQTEPTDINALCDEYLRLSFHGLRAKDKSFNAKFETDFDSSLPKIDVVPQDIGRVLLNLINNAFYAVNERSKKDEAGYQPKVSVTTQLKANGQLLISVEDNGSGIPDAIKEKIFQPFFTTKPTGQGTGLGLSLSYDIIKAHGGELKVETKEGVGSEFIISLPFN
jgi:signal transduction histidine kinase/streptogramin lyase